jgi:hypothetical protein
LTTYSSVIYMKRLIFILFLVCILRGSGSAQERFSTLVTSGQVSYAGETVETTDGGFLNTQLHYVTDSLTTHYYGYVCKLDHAGILQWGRRLYTDAARFILRPIALADGSVLLSGTGVVIIGSDGNVLRS